MDIKSNDKWLIAGAKLAGGTISKTTVAAFAALEFAIRSAMLILAGLPYCLNLISSKTFTDMAAKTTSAFKTIGGAIAALATIRAAEKKENSLLPSKAKLYDTMSSLKEKVSGTYTKMINNPYPTAAVATAVVIGVIALYYNYPTAAPQVKGNEMCHLYSMCDRISLNPDQSSVLPVSKWRLNQFLQQIANDASTWSKGKTPLQYNRCIILEEQALKELSPKCADNFSYLCMTALAKKVAAGQVEGAPQALTMAMRILSFIAESLDSFRGDEPLLYC